MHAEGRQHSEGRTRACRRQSVVCLAAAPRDDAPAGAVAPMGGVGAFPNGCGISFLVIPSCTACGDLTHHLRMEWQFRMMRFRWVTVPRVRRGCRVQSALAGGRERGREYGGPKYSTLSRRNNLDL